MFKLNKPLKLESSSSPSKLPPHSLAAAFFAGGNFLDLEATFGRVHGVIFTANGYCGGSVRKPTYEQVSEGRTGHTEAVRVVYDSRSVSYASLCDVFWQSHDPTNKDFLEFGANTHRRSAIYYGTVEERKVARQSKIRWQMKLERRIVTKIQPLISSASWSSSCSEDEDDGFFYLAENEYQKCYLQRQHWLCIRMGLRSTSHFVRSNLACKLNGILAMDERQVMESLSSFVRTQELCDEVKLELEHIIQHLHTSQSRDKFSPRKVL